jgi:hypothetical protein
MISVTQLNLPQTTRRYEVLSICHISCPNVKLSLTHLQVPAGESAVLASQFSQHNLKPGFLLKNITMLYIKIGLYSTNYFANYLTH